METQLTVMETQTTDRGNQIADRGNQTPIVDTQPVDRGHQLTSRDCLTLGQATQTADRGHQLTNRDCLTLGLVNQPRPTVNDTVRADKKLTNRATQFKRPKTPTQYAHNYKPHLPSHKPKLAIESAATPPNCPDDHSDSTQDENGSL
jgi:hypothetical protein